MQKLSWREKYAGILVLLIGIISLLMQVANLTSNTSRPYSIQQGSLVIDKNELLGDIKTYLVIILGLLGGWLLLRSKRTGWVFGQLVLLLFTSIISLMVVDQFIKTKRFNTMLTASGAVIFFLLLAVLFLFLPSARQKYRASKGTVLLTLLLFMA